MWLFTGLLIGLGLAYFLWSKGYIPQPGVDSSAAGESTAQSSAVDDEEVAPASGEPPKSRYDLSLIHI